MRVFIILLALLIHTTAFGFSYTLELSEAQLQAKAEALMPLEKKKFFITIILTDPEIELVVDSNNLNLTSVIEIKVPGDLQGNGKVKFSGTLRYDNKQGAFYFDEFQIVDLEVEGLPEAHIPKVKKVVEFVALKFLSRKPVFVFKDDNLKHKLAKASVKSIIVEEEKLKVELGLF